jgi:cation/acetate symporter
MLYETSLLPVVLFGLIVASVLGISVYFARRTQGAKGFYAAGGTVPWAVNGIAFAGDYLSAASFLGICGMLAFFGYDGFLYSIGYLAGWVVALFVIAEPLKRMGKFTFTDALDSRFNAKGIQLTAGLSTLVVSIFYLIPQMVGAGALVTPLLGFPHYVGVILVGGIVIFIVATAGMKSTTYVQFMKGALLIVFSAVVVFFVLQRGVVRDKPSAGYHDFTVLTAQVEDGRVTGVAEDGYRVASLHRVDGLTFVKLVNGDAGTWWTLDEESGTLLEAPSKSIGPDGTVLYNGAPQEAGRFYQVGHASTVVRDGREVAEARNLNPFNFLSILEDSEIVRFTRLSFRDGSDRVTVWHQEITPGELIMRPGLKFRVDRGSTPMSRLNFASLMIALFLGTSALPHILIRYYTVPSPRAARQSTILAICAIGFFYILTMYMGLGAMINGVLDLESSNMAAPLLARSIGAGLFAVISAVAFATVLGTVSGLIVATSGAVAHDLVDDFFGLRLTDGQKVVVGKLTAVSVGVLAIVLGILFKGMNVSFLVGWAFAVAASANFPAIIMLLFWRKTTSAGITASILVGIASALAIILLSPSMFERYGLDARRALIPLDNPGIVSIPLSFLTLVAVSLLTRKKNPGEASSRRTRR